MLMSRCKEDYVPYWGIFADNQMLAGPFQDLSEAKTFAKAKALNLAHDMWILDDLPTVDEICPFHDQLRAEPFCAACAHGE